ncbi:hypothetical protein [Larkinella soli]|uniref:hypothetical protein n=1 Tax=Larkinella soli TaxID=1770527 RepID=UPI000FFBF6F9|nr:hypothetical protein [Larkinella soli]
MPPEKSDVPKKSVNVELLLAISATFLSLCALIVSIFQTGIAREQTVIAQQQQQASVWPHVQLAYSQNGDQFTWSVLNNGVGPAVVKAVSIRYQGKKYPTHYALLSEMMERYGQGARIQMDIADISPGNVLKSDGELVLGRLANSRPVADALRGMIMDSSFHFRLVYADVYGNCWQNDQDQVTRLSRCPDR